MWHCEIDIALSSPRPRAVAYDDHALFRLGRRHLCHKRVDAFAQVKVPVGFQLSTDAAPAVDYLWTSLLERRPTVTEGQGAIGPFTQDLPLSVSNKDRVRATLRSIRTIGSVGPGSSTHRPFRRVGTTPILDGTWRTADATRARCGLFGVTQKSVT